MDLVVMGMGGGLREEQLAKELRAMGLKWGQLTSGQVYRIFHDQTVMLPPKNPALAHSYDHITLVF